MSGQSNDGQGPYGGPSFEPKRGFFTGKNLHATGGSRTIFDADLIEGLVLQEDPHHHEQSDATLKQIGHIYGTPTAGFKTGFGVVVGTPSLGVNDLVSGSATLRKGGGVMLATKGMCLARVNGACTAGVTELAPGTDGVLVPTSPTTVAHLLTRVGSTAKRAAVAMEDNASGAALILVKLCAEDE